MAATEEAVLDFIGNDANTAIRARHAAALERAIDRARRDHDRAVSTLRLFRANQLPQSEMNLLHGRALQEWPNLRPGAAAQYQELLIRDLLEAYTLLQGLQA
jgi:hypothetical protein